MTATSDATPDWPRIRDWRKAQRTEMHEPPPSLATVLQAVNITIARPQ